MGGYRTFNPATTLTIYGAASLRNNINLSYFTPSGQKKAYITEKFCNCRMTYSANYLYIHCINLSTTILLLLFCLFKIHEFSCFSVSWILQITSWTYYGKQFLHNAEDPTPIYLCIFLRNPGTVHFSVSTLECQHPLMISTHKFLENMLAEPDCSSNLLVITCWS